MAVGSSGNAYAAGVTYSDNLPTTASAFQPANLLGQTTGFVTKVDTLVAGQSSLVYSTYFGDPHGGYSGNGNPFAAGNHCESIAVDSAGNAYVTGDASSADFPTTPNSIKPVFDDNADAFVAKLDTTKSGSASAYCPKK